MRKTLILLVPVVLLSACSWGITPDPGSQDVRTAWSGDVSGCRDLGKITVSVMNHVGPVDRNTITVRDELQVMARNQAADMHADTIKPLAEPSNGSQPWGAYECGVAGLKRGPQARPAGTSTAPGSVQTFPIKGGG